MKTRPILYSLFAFLSLDALAHPGHEAGSFAPVAGLSTGYLWSLLALSGLVACVVALRAFRRRKTRRDDD